jgi:hypothetical protein
MLHAERIAFNWLNGQKIWAFRDLHGSAYGDDWRASLVVIKARWFCRRAKIILAHDINTLSQIRDLNHNLARLGFTRAWSIRHGRVKEYRVT